MDDISEKFVELAPLSSSFALHLANYLLKQLPGKKGRPPKQPRDVVTRAEQQLLKAMDLLIPLIHSKRQLVYDLINPILITGGSLTNKWMVPTLSKYTPGEMMIYPQRLAEWEQVYLLLYNADGSLEPNNAGSMLLARIINPNRTGWLPRPPRLESYWCWRQDASDLAPYPYEMPVISVNEELPNVIRILPQVKETPSLLWTSWKGAAWDDKDDWLVIDAGAIRWLGEPTQDQLSQWLSPPQLADIARDSTSQAELARRALPILADERLSHQEASSNASGSTE